MEEQNRFFLNYGKVFNWINTKFSAFVLHMSGLNWRKNFSHCSISGPVAPSSMPKLKTPLATIFVEKKIWKKFWWGSRPNWVTPWKEFVISWKKWRFEIFRTSLVSRASGSWSGLPKPRFARFWQLSNLGKGKVLSQKRKFALEFFYLRATWFRPNRTFILLPSSPCIQIVLGL